MSDFPLLKTGAVAQYPASRRIEHSTCVLRFLDGTEQRFREYPRPLRQWEIRLELLDESEMARLEEFFEAHEGRLGSFSFTDPWDETVYENCSLESDILALDFQDVMRGQTTLIVEENGE
jgi:hypothetical protein